MPDPTTQCEQAHRILDRAGIPRSEPIIGDIDDLSLPERLGMLLGHDRADLDGPLALLAKELEAIADDLAVAGDDATHERAWTRLGDLAKQARWIVSAHSCRHALSEIALVPLRAACRRHLHERTESSGVDLHQAVLDAAATRAATRPQGLADALLVLIGDR